MLALSRAIEDECRAHADRPQLIAAFQTRTAYAAGRPRWDDLIDTSAGALVFADFPRSRLRAGSLEIAIPAGDPLRREWSVVCDAPASAAVLAGWEHPDGRFEAIWTVDPDIVRLATELGRRLAAHHAPRLELPAPPAWSPSHDPVAELRRSTAITNRVIAHLDRRDHDVCGRFRRMPSVFDTDVRSRGAVDGEVEHREDAGLGARRRCGMALTTCMAVARQPAKLWSPWSELELELELQVRVALDEDPVALPLRPVGRVVVAQAGDVLHHDALLAVDHADDLEAHARDGPLLDRARRDGEVLVGAQDLVRLLARSRA